MSECRGCGKPDLTRVLDLGNVPAADHFPRAEDPIELGEAAHALAMDMCVSCGLAQLADDDTVTEEPRGVEPQALKDQARSAIEQVETDGWFRGDTVIEFGSPHGGTWIPLLTDRGFHEGTATADVVLDCFGIMHEPDQRGAFARRASVVESNGVLLLQYHSLVTIVQQKQWNALRHGHFAYYSMSALVRLLAEAGMRIVKAWEFGLYGGTVLCAAVHEDVKPDESVLRILENERVLAAETPAFADDLQRAADCHAKSLRQWLEVRALESESVYAYGAASRAVALFSRAGIDSSLLAGVADASPAKQGRRMPGTDIPIVSPEELVVANPDRVLLTLPDLLAEVRRRYPQFDGRWRVDAP